MFLALFLALSASSFANSHDAYYSAVADKICELTEACGGLPYISFVDINRAGLEELIVDSRNGAAGTGLVHNRDIEQMGKHIYLVKNACSMYYWYTPGQRLEEMPLDNNNMFISYNPNRQALITSVSTSGEDRYCCLRITEWGNVEIEYYTFSYSGSSLIKAERNGYKVDGWQASFEVMDILQGCMPLSFTMYS